MADKSDTLVALATYNEIDNLPQLVEAIRQQLPAADLLVVDDNSPDGTGRWCEDFAKSALWFTCQHRPKKLGLGSALVAAMQVAIDDRYRLLVTLDADWSHPPDRLKQLVAATESNDVAIGSRYCQGGVIENWKWQRRLASRVINWLSGVLAGLRVSDSSGNFRAYRTEALCHLRWDQLKSSGYAYLEEVLWHLQQAGATFIEVPITFSDRRAGESKVSYAEALGKIFTLIRLALRRLFSRVH